MVTPPDPSLPEDAAGLALVLAISLFLGLEREQRKQQETQYAFGGVRSLPLIGLVSYALSLLSGSELTAWVVGFAVIGAFMLLSYKHKLAGEPSGGVAAELSALVTYVVGGLVQHEHYWIATTIGVVSVLLLELRKALEELTRYVASAEIVTVAKFLVLVAVVLPILPNQSFTALELNPFKIWLVVVAVSGVSFASYVIQRLLKGRSSLMLSAILGGAYSSTVTTVVLAREARTGARSHQFAGSILTASGVMYVRLVVLLAMFNARLAAMLAPAFGALAATAVLVGWLVYRRSGEHELAPSATRAVKNPLELGAAFLFGAVFVGVVALTHLARTYLGQAGLYSLAAIMGVTDVDPFILGLTQTSASTLPVGSAAAATLIAAASNNAVKAIYAYAFADRVTGRLSMILLLGLAALGLLPLLWL